MATHHLYRYSDWFDKTTCDIDEFTAAGEIAQARKRDLPAGMTCGKLRYKRAEVRPRAFVEDTNMWFLKVKSSDRPIELRGTSAGQWDTSVNVGLGHPDHDGLTAPWTLAPTQFASSVSPGSGTARTLIATDILTESGHVREADRGLPLWQMVNPCRVTGGELPYVRDPHQEWVVYAAMNGTTATLPGWLRLEMIYVSEGT